jgi:hypothetical protein
MNIFLIKWQIGPIDGSWYRVKWKIKNEWKKGKEKEERKRIGGWVAEILSYDQTREVAEILSYDHCIFLNSQQHAGEIPLVNEEREHKS